MRNVNSNPSLAFQIAYTGLVRYTTTEWYLSSKQKKPNVEEKKEEFSP